MDLSNEAIVTNLIVFAAAVIGGVAGGIVTGIFTLKATDKAISDQNEKERRHEETEVQNLLDALGVEIKTLWDFHMRRTGLKVEELADGVAFEMYYPLTQDYFTIYNSNAASIGRIKDCDLSEAIVVCYNKCKKVVDGFKYNNELVREYRDLRDLPPTSECIGRAETKHQELVDFAVIIKEDHYELKGYVEKLLELLNNRK